MRFMRSGRLMVIVAIRPSDRYVTASLLTASMRLPHADEGIERTRDDDYALLAQRVYTRNGPPPW